MPKAWLQNRKRDYYYKKAKKEKYRSRAAYKLFQVNEKYNIIKKGDFVVDLGAAPGGWTQVAGKIVGSSGFVLGVDVKPITPLFQSNVRTIIGDIREQETLQRILEFLPTKVNVVISDVSQNISGIWEIDHARQIDLTQHALTIALKILQPSGYFLVKVFHGDLLNNFIRTVKKHFEVVKILKPKASRAKSSEIYLLGMYLKALVN